MGHATTCTSAVMQGRRCVCPLESLPPPRLPAGPSRPRIFLDVGERANPRSDGGGVVRCGVGMWEVWMCLVWWERRRFWSDGCWGMRSWGSGTRLEKELEFELQIDDLLRVGIFACSRAQKRKRRSAMGRRVRPCLASPCPFHHRYALIWPWDGTDVGDGLRRCSSSSSR